MDWLTDPSVWVGLATLVVMEIVLGVDNLIFISILAGRLPPHQRERARVIGLVLALGMRLALLGGISWVMSLTQPVLTVLGQGLSWRDLILIGGGGFLLVKATMEIHERLEVHLPGHEKAPAGAAFWPVVAQIIVLDVVFSLDSVITAIGMVDEVYVMMAAVVVSVAVMLVAAKPLSEFITARPSLIILCLGFLLMIGLVLVVDGFGIHVPKGYVYAAIGFSVLVELLNQTAQRKRREQAEKVPARRRAAYAVLQLVGGVPAFSPDAPADVAAATLPETPDEALFSPLERRMVRGVLAISRQPVTAVMTPRAEVEWIDVTAGRDAILAKLRATRYSDFPVGRGSIDNLVGVARKEDLLAPCLQEASPDFTKAVTEPVAVPESMTVLDALALFKRSPVKIAVVVDEYGGLRGIVTGTDLLEAIAGTFARREGEAPAVTPLPDGAFAIDGGLPVLDLQERLHLEALPEGSFETAAGLVLAILARHPSAGDTVDWGGWTFKVAEMHGLAIKRLLVTRGAPGGKGLGKGVPERED